jgi:raffinose/stachyose/melibiose transport system permease protein
MTVPKDLDEAALIDGAGFWRIFWSVNLPLVRSGLATAGILMFLSYWNEYFYALILTTGAANRTLPVALAFFDEAFSYNYTRMFAALTLVVLPGIIIYLLVQEQVQKSVASTGIKG